MHLENQADSSAEPGHPGVEAAMLPVALLRFEDGHDSLSDSQQVDLQRWIHAWPRAFKAGDVVVSGARKSPRVARLRRLNQLIQLLARFGITARRILVDTDWLKPAPMGPLDDLPADTVQLRLTRHTRRSKCGDPWGLSKVEQKLAMQ